MGESPGPQAYRHEAPKLTGLAGGFATERKAQPAPKRELPQMEGIFGLGCSVEEHIM
jgi:hypothetical protein